MGLWRMDEEPDQLYVCYSHLRCLAMPFRSVGRQKEYLSVRALLQAMTGDDTLCIRHEESGRPVVCRGLVKRDDMLVSISHTRGYAVLMLSRTKAVGVDIEYRSDRIVKIASHFIRPDEMVGSVEQMLALWCAKETLYKLHSEDSLHYFDMRQVESTAPAAGADDWDLVLENMKRGERVTVHVTLTPDYCLTWAVSSSTNPCQPGGQPRTTAFS